MLTHHYTCNIALKLCFCTSYFFTEVVVVVVVVGVAVAVVLATTGVHLVISGAAGVPHITGTLLCV